MLEVEMPVHGIIGKKIGTTQMFREDGRADAVTVVQAGPCTVTQVKTEDTDGYVGVQLGYEEAKSLNRPAAGHSEERGQEFPVPSGVWRR